MADKMGGKVLSRTLSILSVLFLLCVSSIYAETAEEYCNRGAACYKQGNLTQAISDYTKATEINPKDAEAYIGRGLIYSEQSNLIQAISDYSKAIEINPKLTETYYSRGIAYYRVKEYDKAWIDVHKAEELGYQPRPDFLEKLKKVSGREK